MRLKGQMIYVPETDLVLFLCSPSVLNLDDLNRRGLYLYFYLFELNIFLSIQLSIAQE